MASSTTAQDWDDREKAIMKLVDETMGREGELEFDESCAVSEGDDNGAYVQGWVWVDFTGTPLCKAQHIEPIVRGEGCMDDDCPCWPDSVQP